MLACCAAASCGSTKTAGKDAADVGEMRTSEVPAVPDLVRGELKDATQELHFDGSEMRPREDASHECGEGPGNGAGCPCVTNADCLSGWCVLHLGEMVCTDTCVEECPAGWECKEVSATGTDTAWICLSLAPSLCLPCADSQGCEQGKCIRYGDEAGAFCGANCDATGSCPAGYECKAANTVEGTQVPQCVLTAGECTCTAHAIAGLLETACYRSNQWGKCGGVRMCGPEGLSDCSAPLPSAEVCDGQDNDCDGSTDKDPKTGSSQALCDDAEPCTDDCGGRCGELVPGDAPSRTLASLDPRLLLRHASKRDVSEKCTPGYGSALTGPPPKSDALPAADLPTPRIPAAPVVTSNHEAGDYTPVVRGVAGSQSAMVLVPDGRRADGSPLRVCRASSGAQPGTGGVSPC